MYRVKFFDATTGLAVFYADTEAASSDVDDTKKTITYDQPAQPTVGTVSGNLAAYFNSIYTPNTIGSAKSDKRATVPFTKEITDKVLNLFTVVYGSAPANDWIALSGTDIPVGDTTKGRVMIDVGIPGVDNDTDAYTMPDVVIPAGGLGDADGTPAYTYAAIRVNDGAYVDIFSDQENFSDTDWTDGRFLSGNLIVANGGKLRDSAYKGFPLGTGSTITVRFGGYFGVFPEGEADGRSGLMDNYYDRTYTGWMIAPANTANAWAVWSVSDENSRNGYLDCYEVDENGSANVLLNGVMDVTGTMNMMYNVYMTRGSKITVKDGGELTNSAGYALNSRTTTGFGIMGQTASSAQGDGGFVKTAPASVVVEAGGKLSKSMITAKATDLAGIDPDGTGELPENGFIDTTGYATMTFEIVADNTLDTNGYDVADGKTTNGAGIPTSDYPNGGEFKAFWKLATTPAAN
jgi:hypothetical protein